MFNATDDGLGLGLQSRARQHRATYNTDSQSIADSLASLLGNPQIGWNARQNNARQDAFAAINPQWDAYFQSLDEVAGDRDIDMIGGRPPAAMNGITSNAVRGTSAQTRPMRPSIQSLFVDGGPFASGRPKARA